ncbi:ankyrin repeat-containing protein [Anaeramoeba flamelloides]|uniref:Ankyrin repeat-containing protein n=1 Tax=Anaeramoeba flamelloides TaxID=1746091 RepID=A0ABQ8XPL4_9EUKA|nr:ankyrin repeat-containing protein [Anaeramoeba flamelloides]
MEFIFEKLYQSKFKKNLKYFYEEQYPFHSYFKLVKKIDKEIVQLFLKKKYSQKQKDFAGMTPFQYLYQTQKTPSFEIVKYLIENKADLKESVLYRRKVGMTAFQILCENENNETLSKELIELCLQNGSTINEKDKNGKTTPLQYYCSGRPTLEMLEFFIAKGADVCSVDRQYEHVFFTLIRNENAPWECIKYFFDKKTELQIDLFRVNCYDKNAFFALCERRQLKIEEVEFFLNNGFTINAQDNYWTTTFHELCDGYPTIELLQYFLENGAKIDAEDRMGSSPFHFLVSNKHIKDHTQLKQLVTFMLKNGVDINRRNNWGGDVFYYLSTREFDLDLIKFFIEKGADVHHRDEYQSTIAHNFCGSSCISKEILVYLFEMKIDIFALNGNQISPFDNLFQMQGPNFELIKYYHSKGVDLLRTDSTGRTFLHRLYFAESGDVNLEIFSFFLENGVDINTVDNNKKTAFHNVCSRNTTLEIIKFFIKNGANFNLEDKDGLTPIHHLFANSSLTIPILIFLLNHGINPNQTNKNNESYFHFYMKNRAIDYDIVKCFLENNADPNLKNNNNKTVSFLCIRRAGRVSNLERKRFVKLFSVDFNSLKNDFKNFFEKKEFTDFEINGIKMHKFLLEKRINKSIEDITKVLKKYSNKYIIKFLKWAYYNEIEIKNDNDNKNENENDNKNENENEMKKINKLNQIFLELDIDLKYAKANDNLKQFLRKLYLDEDSKDFSIIFKKNNNNENEEKVDFGQIKVHKFLLQCRSGLYRKMFLSIEDPEIKQINDYSGKSMDVIQILIYYLYNDRKMPIDLTQKQFVQLKNILGYFQIDTGCSFKMLYNL